MSSPLSSLQQAVDLRSYPNGASPTVVNGVPEGEILPEDSILPNVVDDYQQVRTKAMQDMVLNITRLA